VEAMFLAISIPLESNPFHVYNIGSEKSISLNDLIGYINNAFSKRIEGYSILIPTYQGERPGDIRHSIASIDRIHAALGWSPSVLFEDGIYEQVKAWLGVKEQ
jgi:nucleoside-diphosphate-sugar epimerase